MSTRELIFNTIQFNANNGTWLNADGMLMADEVNIYDLTNAIEEILNKNSIRFAEFIKNSDFKETHTTKELLEIYNKKNKNT